MHRTGRHLPFPELNSAPPHVTLRRVTSADEPFLASLYASTRMEELATTEWDAAAKSAFCALQFRAQTTDYTRRFGTAGHSVIEVDGEPVGRIWTCVGKEECRIVDVALLPERQGAGIGTALLRDVLRAAEQADLPIRLTVARGNARSARFFERLGCVAVGSDSTHVFYERG